MFDYKLASKPCVTSSFPSFLSSERKLLEIYKNERGYQSIYRLDNRFYKVNMASGNNGLFTTWEVAPTTPTDKHIFGYNRISEPVVSDSLPDFLSLENAPERLEVESYENDIDLDIIFRTYEGFYWVNVRKKNPVMGANVSAFAPLDDLKLGGKYTTYKVEAY